MYAATATAHETQLGPFALRPQVHGSEVSVRPARREDCYRIAELFRISSDGVADYIWSQMDEPELSPLQIGQRRYERENTAFSYQNCLVADRGGQVLAMMHAFVIEPSEDDDTDEEPGDPVLQPYNELEAPGSLYISGLAVLPGFRSRGLGSELLAAARAQARSLGADQLSLLCFAENEAAVRLYQRNGFEIVDSRPVQPHPLIHYGGDVLLMTAPV